MKNAVSPEAAKLLRKVAEHILEEPRRYDQNAILSFGNPGDVRFVNDHEQAYPQCGTMACIAGWITVLSAPAKKRTRTLDVNFPKIRRMLGITEEQLAALTSYTYHEGWPPNFAAHT